MEEAVINLNTYKAVIPSISTIMIFFCYIHTEFGPMCKGGTMDFKVRVPDFASEASEKIFGFDPHF
jgi:hypothetical protein